MIIEQAWISYLKSNLSTATTDADQRAAKQAFYAAFADGCICGVGAANDLNKRVAIAEEYARFVLETTDGLQ